MDELKNEVTEEVLEAEEKVAEEVHKEHGLLGDDGKLTDADFTRIFDEVKEMEFMKKILGDDGELTDQDFKEAGEKMKETMLGKTIFGDDGKFTDDDLHRFFSRFKK